MVRLQQNIARRSGKDRGSEAAEPHEAAEATSSSATGVEVMGPQLVGAPPTPEPTHFLLYLNKRTFLDGAGTALADEVRAALAAGLPIAMIHEKDEAHTERRGCAFNTFFKTVCSGTSFAPLSQRPNSTRHARDRRRRKTCSTATCTRRSPPRSRATRSNAR